MTFLLGLCCGSQQCVGSVYRFTLSFIEVRVDTKTLGLGLLIVLAILARLLMTKKHKLRV